MQPQPTTLYDDTDSMETSIHSDTTHKRPPKVEDLEERDFQTSRNEAFKVLSGIQNREGEMTH